MLLMCTIILLEGLASMPGLKRKEKSNLDKKTEADEKARKALVRER